MNLIVDVQFFLGGEGVYVPKEVALLTLNENYLAHWIVAPPYDAEKLEDNVKKTNKWLTRNHLGLDWHDAGISRKALVKNLQAIARDVDTIYVRGADKVAFLKNIISRDIVNLETREDCPTFSSLAPSDVYCVQHSLKKSHTSFNCALNNAIRLRKWLILNADKCRDVETEPLRKVPVAAAAQEKSKGNEHSGDTQVPETI